MASDDEQALITRLRETFAETAKSRPEAAGTRMNISAKTKSTLEHDGNELPKRVLSHSKEITGIRRRYLEALKQNIEARQRYDLASLQTTHARGSPLQADSLYPDALLSSLELSRLERKHKEVKIRLRFASTLSQDGSTCNLRISPSQQQSRESGDNILGENDTPHVVEIEALISKLQRALLQASHQLKRQRTLLAGARQKDKPPTPGQNRATEEARAVEASRDALVIWLDEKLSASGADEADYLAERNGDFHRDVSQPVESTKNAYQNYLSARKAVIKAAHEAIQLLPASNPNLSDNAEVLIREVISTSDDLDLIHAVRKHLIPLLQQQSDNVTLKGYSSAQVAKERQDTLAALERLADESHLISVYPASDIKGSSELERNVAAWVQAANTSSVSSTAGIEEHHKRALQALEQAEEELAVMKSQQETNEKASNKNGGIHWNGIHGKLCHRKVT